MSLLYHINKAAAKSDHTRENKKHQLNLSG